MIRREPRERIVGIDWLEMFVNESYGIDYSANGFRERGYFVQERDYGTKTMGEMFVILDQRGYPFVEIRRAPRGLNTLAKQTVYQEGDSYVRLSNLYCYDDNPITLLSEFLRRERYQIKKIYRIDLYTDFEIFDSGDKPANVVRRIVNHTYSKINQSHRRTSGEDTWTECVDNWISWGKKGSMVSTKIYDKTKELKETGMHKPYIVEKWRRAGYVDNVVDITKDGQQVQMWRIEFSIKGNAKGWIYVDKSEAGDGKPHTLEHTLELYASRQGIVNAIANLVPYYFRFKIYEEGKRKSLCRDKVLFIFSEDEYESGYRLTNEGDIERVRHVEIEDDVIAVNHLVRAKMKLIGTEFDPTLTEMITKMMTRIDRKSANQYTDRTDIF